MGKVKQMLTDEQQEYVEGLRCELSEAEGLLRLALLAADNCRSNLDWLEVCVGETLEAEDRAVLDRCFSDLAQARAFLERNKQ